MTAIAGIVTPNNEIWIGGDRAASNRWTIQSKRSPKVFRIGEFLFGGSGSIRAIQVAQYSFSPPTPNEGEDVMHYMASSFIRSLRQAMENARSTQNHNGEESIGTNFMVAYRKRLFTIYSDYQVMETSTGYAAIGSGAEVCLGSLHATESTKLKARTRIERALQAAEDHTPYVRGPFDVIQL